ncbi:DUF1214 domain-containing protein [Brucellaceae bacterium C25G]
MMKLIVRNLTFILFVMLVALGGGIWSARWALDHFGGFNELRSGEWVSYPSAGNPNADPYAKARSARSAHLSLGSAEGLIFYARTSSDGKILERGCSYRITGTNPNARLWTLFVIDNNGTLLSSNKTLPTSLLSSHIVYNDNGSFDINISQQAQGNNWLSVDGSGQFILVMTLYDTPVASSSSFSDITMPRITALRNGGKC